MPLKIIGAGFGRTGTMSLKLALEILGFGPCYHMIEVFPNPMAPGYWAAAARAEPVDWETVFKGYNATVNWPSCTYWRELADYYADAKVILTERDADTWFDSTRNTIFAEQHIGRLLKPDTPPDLRAMMERLYTRTFDGRGEDRAYATGVFKTHNAQVKATIAPERLLAFDVAQGWAPLCEFLNVPVPDASFPRTNTSEDWRQHHANAAMPS